MVVKFVEEWDGQPLDDGDYGPLPDDDGIRHFVRMRYRAVLLDRPLASGIEPDDMMLCGKPTPDWRADPKRYPIAGKVTCPRCRALSVDSAVNE